MYSCDKCVKNYTTYNKQGGVRHKAQYYRKATHQKKNVKLADPDFLNRTKSIKYAETEIIY